MAEPSKLGERLIQAGLITQQALSQALELQRRAGGRLGDCLVELRLISEQALLRFLATEFSTRYVSAEKLSKVKIGPEVLDRVPVRMAEKAGVIPINFDGNTKVLSVVMAEPQNKEVVDELKMVTGATEVVTFIALRSSVNAGVKKFYYGDPSAFAMMDQSTAQQQRELSNIADYYEAPRADTRQVSASDFQVEGTRSGQSSISRLASEGQSLRTATGASQPTSVRRAIDAIQRSSVVSDNDYVETLNVLVSLLEMQGRMKGHSARVAKLVRTVAMRLGMSARDLNYATIAAYLHELGKTGGGHVTLLSTQGSEEHQALAKKFVRAPLNLFETVHLPSQVATILAQLFEAFDGTGLPHQVKGADIAMGARILAAADSFEDLTTNPDSLAGEVMGKEQALKTMSLQSGKLFNPSVLEILEQISTGELLRQRLQAEGHQVLLAEPDEPVREGLSRALSQVGLTITAVTNSELALQQATQGEADLVIADVNLQPDDAFVLTAELRQEPLTASIPVLFLSDTDDPKTRERASQLGVAAILLKPVDEEQLAETCRTLLEERIAAGAPHRSVAGSLDELALPDLLRILASGKRSGQLALRSDEARGEIYLEKGRLVHAVCGQAKGKAAIAVLLTWLHGDFRLDPNVLILEQQLDVDVEVALREAGMRNSPRTSPEPISLPVATKG